MDRVRTIEGIFFNLRVNFLICSVASAVALGGLVSFVIISWYDLYDIRLSNRSFVGIIEPKPALDGV